MANGTVPEEISDTEELARFVVFNNWIRNDNTVKPEAFMPHPYLDLSVTRRIGLSGEELWTIGRAVAAKRSRPLHGSADIIVAVVKSQELLVQSAPVAENLNHANVKGWPTSKPEQKMKALEIANTAIFSRYTT
ncbi:MAG: hypothetical protein PHC90_11000 [Syntrophorhabdaceae bacterium]|nr:hypothetical protein [Syntrophorhabdaceae bacterium]